MPNGYKINFHNSIGMLLVSSEERRVQISCVTICVALFSTNAFLKRYISSVINTEVNQVERAKPKLAQKRTTIERIVDKMVDFVDTFIGGMGE